MRLPMPNGFLGCACACPRMLSKTEPSTMATIRIVFMAVGVLCSEPVYRGDAEQLYSARSGLRAGHSRCAGVIWTFRNPGANVGHFCPFKQRMPYESHSRDFT